MLERRRVPDELWVAGREAGPERALTSAVLARGAEHDTVWLYVKGELATQFDVASGLGEQVLTDCGMTLIG